MFALILDSLGSTELLFILVVALVFFGPRRLPQLSRSLGKSLAEFRRASEDFKRTWEREVALEEARSEEGTNSALDSALAEPYRNDDPALAKSIQEPSISPIPAEHIMAREASSKLPEPVQSDASQRDVTDSTTQSSPKRDWL